MAAARENCAQVDAYATLCADYWRLRAVVDAPGAVPTPAQEQAAFEAWSANDELLAGACANTLAGAFAAAKIAQARFHDYYADVEERLSGDSLMFSLLDGIVGVLARETARV